MIDPRFDAIEETMLGAELTPAIVALVGHDLALPGLRLPRASDAQSANVVTVGEDCW